jgi:hypothetical protein
MLLCILLSNYFDDEELRTRVPILTYWLLKRYIGKTIVIENKIVNAADCGFILYFYIRTAPYLQCKLQN